MNDFPISKSVASCAVPGYVDRIQIVARDLNTIDIYVHPFGDTASCVRTNRKGLSDTISALLELDHDLAEIEAAAVPAAPETPKATPAAPKKAKAKAKR